MATKPKYTGVTPIDGGWQYRIKMKINGEVIDTRIKRDSDGLPFLTAKAAFEAKAQHIEKLKKKPLETPSEPQSVTLSQVYANYMETEAKEKRPATLRKQDSMWINHVEPKFGSRDINSINIIELRSFLVEQYQKYSYMYVEGFLKFFYLLFGHADRMGVIDYEIYRRNFISRGTRLEMPAKSQKDNDEEKDGVLVYTNEELKIIEDAFKSEDGNLLMAYYLGIYAGLRIGETFGLRWRDIDFQKKTIKVNRQLQYIDGQWHLCEVKTLNSSRTVFIPSILWEELDLYQQLQEKQKNEMKEAYRDTERVYDEIEKQWLTGSDFVNRKKNGELLTINSVKYWSKEITSLLNDKYNSDVEMYKHWGWNTSELKPKPFHYHALRHTYGTACAMQNVPIFVLSEMLGHKKISTTKEYYIRVDSDLVSKHTLELLDTLYKK